MAVSLLSMFGLRASATTILCFAAFAAILGPVAVGCSGGRESTRERAAKATQRIIGGGDSPAARDAVVELAIRPGGSLSSVCTGTLVAPNLVLTARHCVASSDHTAECTAEGAAIYGGVVHADYAAPALSVYRGTSAPTDVTADGNDSTRAAALGEQLVTEGTSYCNGDLAFLVLDRDLPPPYAPIRRALAPRVGERLTAVGYGLVENGAAPDQRKERTNIPVLAVGKISSESGAGLGDAEFLVGESACSGDSGGPLLSPITGAVVGVVSRGGGGDGPEENAAGACIGETAFLIYSHLAPKTELVERAYAAAGQVVWAEGEINPYLSAAGVPCSTDSECASGTCDDSNACTIPAPPPMPPDGGFDLPDAGASGYGAKGPAADPGGEVPTEAPSREPATASESPEASETTTSAVRSNDTVTGAHVPTLGCAVGASTKGSSSATAILAAIGATLIRRRRRRHHR